MGILPMGITGVSPVGGRAKPVLSEAEGTALGLMGGTPMLRNILPLKDNQNGIMV
jgi:hypothetical protein